MLPFRATVASAPMRAQARRVSTSGQTLDRAATDDGTPMFLDAMYKGRKAKNGNMMTGTPAWIKKSAVQWQSVEDKHRTKSLIELNSSRWKERFVQQHMYGMKISRENWGDHRHEMEPEERCFKQKPLNHPDWHMADKIWPIAMLNTNVIYVSVFLEKLTLVLIPGSPLNHVAEYAHRIHSCFNHTPPHRTTP